MEAFQPLSAWADKNARRFQQKRPRQYVRTGAAPDWYLDCYLPMACPSPRVHANIQPHRYLKPRIGSPGERPKILPVPGALVWVQDRLHASPPWRSTPRQETSTGTGKTRRAVLGCTRVSRDACLRFTSFPGARTKNRPQGRFGCSGAKRGNTPDLGPGYP